MKETCKVLGVVVAVFVGAGIAAAEDVAQAPAEKHHRGGEMFKAMDTDGNGTISLGEFTVVHERRVAERKAKLGDKWNAEREAKMPSAEAIFKKADTNADGQLTKEELAQAGAKRREGDGKGKGKGAGCDKCATPDQAPTAVQGATAGGE
jgi:hypothetical protein